MLLWIRFAHETTLDQRMCDKWFHTTTHNPNQDQCRKEHSTDDIFFTDLMVAHTQSGNENYQQKWRDRVVQGWFHTDDPASAFLRRANKFLRDPEHSIKCMSIFDSVVETQKYVVFLKVSGLVVSLLFDCLKSRKLDFAST